jgi:hypothetical protein
MKTIEILKQELARDFTELNIRELDLEYSFEEWSWELLEKPVLFKDPLIGNVEILFHCVVKSIKGKVLNEDQIIVNVYWDVFRSEEDSDIEGLLLSIKIELRNIFDDEEHADQIAEDCFMDLFTDKGK